MDERLKVEAEFNIDPADRTLFEQMVDDLKTIVASEGDDKVLYYNCTFKEGESGRGIIKESYINEQALLSHLELIAPISKKYDIPMDVIKFQVWGPLSETTLKFFVDAYGDRFDNSLNNLSFNI